MATIATIATIVFGDKKDIQLVIEDRLEQLKLSFTRNGKEINLTLNEFQGLFSLYIWEDTFKEDRTVISLDNCWVDQESDVNTTLRGTSLEVETDRTVKTHSHLEGR